MDRELAEAQLAQMLLAFGCGGPAEQDVVAEYFLLEGAMASYRGDDAGLTDAFRAASGVSAAFWLSSLGPKMQARFIAASELPRFSGELLFEPALDGQTVLLDGRPVTPPYVASDGLHIVQIAEGERVVQASVISVPPEGAHVIEHQLAPWRPPVVEVVEVVEARAARDALVLHVGVGAGLGLGQGLSAVLSTGPREERAVRLGVPVELGLGAYGGRAFVRAAFAATPVLGGELLYGADEGGRGTRLSVGGHVAAGAALGVVDVGVLTGPSWPGRWQVRAMTAVAVPGPFQVELRAGVNAVTERPVEPAGELVLVLQPTI